MFDRLELHDKLKEVIGNNNVYYQPPEKFKINYPCITYELTVGNFKRANNKVYNYTKKYTATCIINSEDDNIVNDMINSFTYCNLENTFVSDNLYHYIFSIYY